MGPEILVARVKERKFQRVDDAACGIQDSAGKQPEESRTRKCLQELTEDGETCPSHRHIDDRRDIFGASHPEQLEQHSDDCDCPDADEQPVAVVWVQHEDTDRRVGARNQDKDHHVIQLLKHPQPFAAQVHRVIEGACGIQQDHAGDKDRHRRETGPRRKKGSF